MLRFAFITALIFIFSTPVFAENTENYCHDKEAYKQWENIAKESPNDLGLQRLHALRLGICQKIENGTLSTSNGIKLFEREREALVRERAEKERSKRERLVH